jgi:hypothetical protein
MSEHGTTGGDIRAQIRAAIAHLGHVLPGQAPIRDFVHHNTLHGLQHRPFREAIGEARRITGTRGLLPPERFRAYYAEGRITRADLEAVLAEAPDLGAGEPLAPGLDGLDPPLTCGDIYLAALLHPIGPITAARLGWQIDELDALHTFQPEVPAAARQRLLTRAKADTGDETRAISDLWAACLGVLGLEHVSLHPEDLVDLSPEQAQRMLAAAGRGPNVQAAAEGDQPQTERQIRIEAAAQLQTLLDRVGVNLTLRGLLRLLTGEDLMDQIRPQLVRHLATGLDEGLAAWRNPRLRPRPSQGLYQAWRLTARSDLTPIFRGLDAWGTEVEALPSDPLEAIVAELKRLGLARERWVSYLERLALELPGWSGMVLWRDLHPGYQADAAAISMLDYLALRLVLERIHAQRLCRAHWQIEASLDMLRWYFRRNPEELLVRHALYSDGLPEYLAARAARAAAHSDLDRGDPGWARLAALLWTWQHSGSGANAAVGPASEPSGRDGAPTPSPRPGGRAPSVPGSAWPLFQAAQHLGLSEAEVRDLGPQGASAILATLGRLEPDTLGYLWLCAFERHYREQILTALAHNHGRGPWSRRDDPAAVPAAQVMFCMDDREEGTRRHLEELAPEVETLGAAAHYSVPHNWCGLDDAGVTALAPVIPAPVIPSQEVREVPRPTCEALGQVHRRRHGRLRAATARLLQGGRLGVLSPALTAALAGPFAGISLAGKLAAPARFAGLTRSLRRMLVPVVDTGIAFSAPNDSPPASPERPRLGYTDQEQAERVQALLASTGLTAGFAPLVIILGHGSRNQNNPHASAYNCGACSGRFSGPNARLVCAMANRPQVRALLAERGIQIPQGTWFVGGEHDTCNDQVDWYDTQDVPPGIQGPFGRVREALDRACRLHAQERCRRFASAPAGMDPDAAHRHVANRAFDISQVRPELGHATNACAFIGRRSFSRGAFFDRRAFLISYDPTQDPNGEVLERHLVINGAVGAGISLEYYFSASNDEGYGCGSKVTHNVAGLLGVMEGTSSDLRTGLPRQMVEIHEAMRLLVVVEQTTDMLSAIYQRQPAVAELVGGAWVQLASLDPQTGAIAVFRPTGMWKSREEAGAGPGGPGTGWVPWEPPAEPPPRVGRSPDWYLGHSGPLPPALIEGGAGILPAPPEGTRHV